MDRIFILGHHKSGTTVIAQLLSKATGKSLKSDIPATWGGNLASLFKGESRLEEIVNENPESFNREIIKEPNLTFFYDQLIRIFPASKYIFIVRHPLDTIRSVLDRIGIRGDLETNPNWKDIPINWRSIFNTDFIESDANQYIDILADRWMLTFGTFTRNRENFILVKYEDFLSNKKVYIDQLAAQLGLRCEHDISPFIDMSYQPRGQSGIDPELFFGGNYKRLLDRLDGKHHSIYPSSTHSETVG